MVNTLPPGSQLGTHNSTILSERLIQDSFHSYLKSSLSQAKAERLVDEDMLSSAEGDLMITGPALCLFFAALRSTTNPPSVPLPKHKSANRASRKNSALPEQPTELSYENCPPAFVSFLRVWANNVPLIQDLAPEYQHDVARAICGLEPLSQPVDIAVGGIAADLRGVAIEISQRRSFQDRYASDLQAALDSGSGGPGKTNSAGSPGPKKATFVPPPLYEPSPPPSPLPQIRPLDVGKPSLESSTSLPPLPARRHRPQQPSASSLSPFSATGFHSRNSSTSSTASLPSPTSPSLLTFDSPAIEFIRETLYASLADQLERFPSLRLQLKNDPTRAYFASVSFAILDVAMNSITEEGEVIGVLGKRLTVDECPPALRPFMTELIAIGKEAREIELQDTELVVRMLESGQDLDALPAPRLERVKRMLEFGIGVERDSCSRERRGSVQGRAVAFANRISALGLGLTKLRAFRERQEHVFKILESIGT